MLDQDSPWAAHALRDVALILFSVLMLPLDTFIVTIALIVGLARPQKKLQPAEGSSKRILVTGVGMSKGLALARIFSAAGHEVIGADFSPFACGRVSRSMRSYHTLKHSGEHDVYAKSLLSIIRTEHIDMWVSCSGVASATEDGEAKELIERTTSCKAVQYDVETTRKLHEKDSFIEHTASLGLLVPETHQTTDKAAMRRILRDAGDMRFVAKSVGVDDANRANMELLSRDSIDENDDGFLQKINVSKENPWILQRFIRGEEFATHALVIRGRVKAFVACPSAELLMHYEALPAVSPLSQAMLAFTETFAAKSGGSFTGHLSFDFLVQDTQPEDPSRIQLYPIECNPRAHTAVLLFNGELDLADRYLSLLLDDKDACCPPSPLQPRKPARYYWNGHDLFTCLVIPLSDLLMGKETIRKCAASGAQLFHYLTSWKDGTFEITDPLPWWWLYHVYLPMRLLVMLVSKVRWSRMNVSTTKMFLC